MRARFQHAPTGRRGFGTDRDGWIAEAKLRGDHSLMPGAVPEPGPRTRAAVLVPLVTHPGDLTVLLTQRTQHLADHPGQVAFPGGRIDPEDADDAVHAALREAGEEIGLPADHVTVIGRLDTYLTGTGYEIIPIVGLVRVPYPVQLHADEVADAFEVPLSLVVDLRNYERRSRHANGRTRNFYVLPFPDRYIWGATAGMLVNLAEVLS